MATLARRGTGTPATTGTTWTTVTNAVDGTPPANPATYAVWTSSTSGATATLEVTGYDFSSIPAGSTINSVTVTLRHFENNATRIPTISWQVYDGATTIGAAQTVTVSLTAADATATRTVTLAQLKSATFKVRTTATRAAVTQSATFNVDHIDVTVDYTEPVPQVTQASYQLYADGTESGSTALAAQDTAPTIDVTADANIQVRVRLQSTDATAIAAGDDFQLQWEKNTSGTWNDVVAPAGILDTYPSSNRSSNMKVVSTGGDSIVCQSFLGDGRLLTQAGFFMNTTPTPNGTLSAVLYAHTGTFGSTGTGTGSPLATSTTSLTSSTLTSTYTWYYFDFAGTFTLAAGTPYCVGVTTTNTVANTVGVGTDITSPTHAGNASRFSTSWFVPAATDIVFEVSTAPPVPSSTVVPYNSANLTDAAATTNRLGAGTGTFVAGKVSEDGTVDDLTWSANNYTEVLYSVTLKAADLAAADTLKFRVLRNGATTGFTYTQTPTVTVSKGAPPAGGKFKVWTGSAWVEKPAKVWSGSTWVEKPVKVWTGSAWVLA